MQGFFATAEGCLADTSMVVRPEENVRQIPNLRHKTQSIVYHLAFPGFAFC
jgi:hypothetical protein